MPGKNQAILFSFEQAFLEILALILIARFQIRFEAVPFDWHICSRFRDSKGFVTLRPAPIAQLLGEQEIENQEGAALLLKFLLGSLGKNGKRLLAQRLAGQQHGRCIRKGRTAGK